MKVSDKIALPVRAEAYVYGVLSGDSWLEWDVLDKNGETVVYVGEGEDCEHLAHAIAHALNSHDELVGLLAMAQDGECGCLGKNFSDSVNKLIKDE